MTNTEYIVHPRLQIIEVETYTPCNRTCSYCPNASNKRDVHYLPMEMIEKIASNLKEMGFTGQFSFQFYNEPLLDKRLPEIIKLVRSYLPLSFLLLYTNGDFLTKDYFLNLIECGIDKFLVTAHEQVNKKHNLDWRYNLPKENLKYLFYQTYKDPDIFYTNRGGLLPNISEIASPLSVSCFLPSTSMTITAKGNAVLCFEDYNESQIMGNIFFSTIQEIWYGEPFKKLRSQLTNGNRHCTNICKKCNNTENSVFEEVNYTQKRILKSV